MRFRALAGLAAVNLALVCVLVLMWVKPDGSPRHVQWDKPTPLQADLSGLVSPLAPVTQVDVSRFLAMLDRPLFTATRRPPPPPVPEVPPPPPDHMSTARVTGIVRGTGSGFAIVDVNGKQRRVQLNQSIEGWTLKSIGERELAFTKGAQTQTLILQRADVSKFSGIAQPIPPSVPAMAGGSGNTPRSGNAGASATSTEPPPAKPRPAPSFGP